MIYLWIFLGSYVVVCAVAFVVQAHRMTTIANGMRSKGMDQAAVDEFYQRMSLPGMLVLAQSTLVWGTALGALGSLLYRFVLT